MTQIISFPGLGIKGLELNSTAFTVFGLDIAWYALIITFGMVLAVAYTIWRASAIGINYEEIIDFAIFVIPFGILGARLYYVLCELDQYSSFWEIFNIRNGGLAIYGGIIAGAVTVFLVCRYKKIYFPALGDCIVPGLILAQSIGRWGNFVNVEAFGSVTSAPWRMSGDSIASYLLRNGQITDAVEYVKVRTGELGVHPTFFYESIWNLIGFIAINFFYKHRKYDGQIILIIFGWYGLGRAWIEGLRTDSLYIPGTPIRVSQLLAILIFLGCLGLLIYFIVKPPKKPLYHKEQPAVADGAPIDGDEKKSAKKIDKVVSKNSAAPKQETKPDSTKADEKENTADAPSDEDSAADAADNKAE